MLKRAGVQEGNKKSKEKKEDRLNISEMYAMNK